MDGAGVREGDSMTSRDPSRGRTRGMHVFFMGVSIRTFSQYSRGMYDDLFGFDGWSAIHAIHARRALDAAARAVRRSRTRERANENGDAFGTRGRRGRAFGTVVTTRVMTMMTMMISIRVASATTWIPLPVDDDRFRVVRGYAPPEYAIDADGRARFRGWFASSTKLDAGDDALATPVPRDARPTREETWRVTLKGHDRALTMTREGRLIVGDVYEADTWFALTGLEYDTAAAFEAEAVAEAEGVAKTR